MGYLKRRIIEQMEPQEEPPMEVLGWIPVEERLPPLLTEVLGWHPDDRVRAWFRHSGQPKDAPYWELWSPQDRECDDCKVHEPTHWMPLPEPPEMK